MLSATSAGSDRSNVRLAHLIQNLAGAVLVEDETRHIVLANQPFCDLFNIPVPPNALIGMDCSNSAEEAKMLFADPKGFVTRIDDILKARQKVADETLHLRDGRVYLRDYVPVYHENEYIGHLWQYRDATGEFQAQQRWQRLLRVEETNREIISLFLQLEDVNDAVNRALAITGQLLDVSRVYVFHFRKNARILDNTHEWCAPGVKPEIDNLQGLPFDDLVPSIFPLLAEHDFIAPYHINDLPEDIRSILEPQDIQSILFVPLYENNRIEGFIGYDETRHARRWLPEEITMGRIITESYARALERTQAEQALIATRDEAISMAQTRAQFVANMSHEIRTPMTGIIGMLELLSETELDELQREFVSDAQQSSAHLLSIVNSILDFSKLEAGQVELDAEPIDVKAIVTEVVMTLAPQIKKKSLDVQVDIDPNVPYRVRGDATRIRQVLMNLGNNAVKFTQQGRITFSVRVAQFTQDVVSLQFSVEDTGIGIEPENLQRIFESFVQADGSITRKYGGSGLGLSISQQLVTLMGGSIAVDSKPGSGSTFSFYLWLPIAQFSSSSQLPSNVFADLRVLIVDNNRTVRYVLTQQLEIWGVQVTQIDTAAQINRVWKPDQPPFDLLFLRLRRDAQLFVPEELGPEVAHSVGFVTDEPGESLDPEHTLVWPVDQSRLYNILVQAIQTKVPGTDAEPDPQPPVDQTTATTRVLVADDSADTVKLVQRVLAALGVQVVSAGNGRDAIKVLESGDCALVLMDMHMPVLDGIATTRQIRQSETAYRDVPVLGLTASVTHEEQQQLFDAGVNEIIVKPFTLKYLLERVQSWIT